MSARVGFPCYECQHRREVPGNAHIQCVVGWTPEEIVGIMRAASKHGVKHGWFYFPFVYDPIWAGEWGAREAGPVECPRFLTTPSTVGQADETRPASATPKASADQPDAR